jgi:hypothetical protein
LVRPGLAVVDLALRLVFGWRFPGGECLGQRLLDLDGRLGRVYEEARF